MSDEHEAFIKTPRQLIAVVLLSFIVPIAIIILLTQYVTSESRDGAGSASMSNEAIEARIRPVANFELRDANAPRVLKSGEDVFKAQCTTCHTAGIAGAPKFGDKDAWAPRIKTGFDALWHSALKGKGNMPPQGGGDFDDIEVARAVVYMANHGGANFPEPSAGGKAADAKGGDAKAADAKPAGGEAPAAAGAAAAAPAAAPTAGAAAASAGAAAAAVAGPVKLFFDTGKTMPTGDAEKELAPVVEAIKSGKAAKAVISGFHDKTGNADQNADLAKQRAMEVSKLLTKAGLTDSQIDLRKPQETTGGADDREARRVEVTAEKG